MTMKAGLGQKQEKITVVFDSGLAAVQYYTAEVALPVRVTPPYLEASKRTPNGWEHTMGGTVTVSSLDGRPFRITASHGATPHLVGFDAATDTPRTEYTLRWDLNRFGGAIPWFWVIETDHPEAPVVDIRIRHSKTLPPRPPKWVAKDQRVLVGTVRIDEPFEITTKVEYHGNLTPEPATAAVVSESPQLRAQLLEAQADGQFIQYRIQVTVTDDADPGLLYGNIAIYASGASYPVHVIGRVET